MDTWNCGRGELQRQYIKMDKKHKDPAHLSAGRVFRYSGFGEIVKSVCLSLLHQQHFFEIGEGSRAVCAFGFDAVEVHARGNL